MAILNTGKDFLPTETVTSAKLEQLVNDASFASGAVDGVTLGINGSGALYVASIDTGQLADDSVTAAKIDLANGVYSFQNAAAVVHYSNQGNPTHSSAGTLTFNVSNGNFQLVNVSANITSVANITNANQLYGGHFTYVLKYSAGSLTGPADGDWGDQWYFPSTFDGTLTMTNNAIDIISGVIVNNGSNPIYVANVIKNFITFS